MKNNNNNLVLVSGLALFSMFFGAGNLIFPPTLGSWVGVKYLSSIIGFCASGVGLVILAVIATTKAGGRVEDLAKKLNIKIGFLFGALVILSIGPGLAIPRTAATTIEILEGSIFPNINPVIASVVYFAITLYFVLKPTSIVNNLGKILTPALLVTLAVIIIKGVLNPMAAPVSLDVENVFGLSFEEGYQTMDALAALAFTSVIIKDYEHKGVVTEEEKVKLTIKSGIIASIGLLLVYGGLTFVGATTSGLSLGEITRVQRLVFIGRTLLGNVGLIIMSAAMALACLTTSIGLVNTVGLFFNRMTNGKLNYTLVCVITSILSAYLALGGVEKIINISVPVLLAMYPVSIVLIVLNLFPNIFNKKLAYLLGIVGALLPTIFNALNIPYLTNIFPEQFASFVWMIPEAILIVIGNVLGKK